MASSSKDPGPSICALCSDEPSKYVCPRCGIQYCSLDCYKSQSHANCSETFYKEWVEQELQQREADPESRRKMLEILQRNLEGDTHSGTESDLDSDDDNEYPDLAERLKNIDLEDADSVWNLLTEEERTSFIQMVKSGDVTKLVPEWEPWWTKSYPKPKVKFADDTAEETYETPEIRQGIADFSTISKLTPSPCVYYNLINVIGAYTIVARYYNGEHLSLPLEASSVMMRTSKTLLSNQTFESTSLAVESVAQEAISNPVIKAGEENIARLKKDVANILAGPNDTDKTHYIQAALSDIHTLLTSSKAVKKKIPRTDPTNPTFTKMFKDEFDPTWVPVSSSTLLGAIKKIEFYQSWVKDCFKTPS